MRKYIINPFTGLLDCIGLDSPTPPTEEYIVFADPEVERICIENWSSDGIGLTYEDASAVISLEGKFCYSGATPPSNQIKSFNELQYFTSLINLGEFDPGPELGQFMGAQELTSIILPPNLECIGFFAFSDCRSLTEIILPNNLQKIGQSAFGYCQSLTSIVIPNSVTQFGGATFSACIKLNSIVFPLGINQIFPGMFANCSGLTSIQIPDSVNEIKNQAFSFSGLILIEIPNSVTSIEEDSFGYCENLKTVISKPINPPLLLSKAFGYTTEITNIFVPAESVDAYKSAEGWSTYADIITAIIE